MPVVFSLYLKYSKAILLQSPYYSSVAPADLTVKAIQLGWIALILFENQL